MHFRSLPIVLSIALSFAGAIRVAAAPVAYDLVDLGTLGGYYSAAFAINDRGEIVGHSMRADGQPHAFRTAPGAPINPLTDDLGTLGGQTSVAYDINNLGQVVGMSTLAGDLAVQRAFRTGASSPINPATDNLGVLGPTDYSTAWGINDSGVVVGYSRTDADEGLASAFRTGPNQAINPQTDNLGGLGGNQVEARNVNAGGQATGYSLVPGAWHSFRVPAGRGLEPEDDLTNPAAPEWTSSIGCAINTSGQVAGTVRNNDGHFHAFRTAANSVFEPLTDDLGLFNGWDTDARSINDAGWVVGLATDRTYPPRNVAMVFDGTEMLDLNQFIDPASGWTLTGAYDINNLGQIVGYGYKQGQTYEEAFLLTPRFAPADGVLLAMVVPEPATPGLLATVAMVLSLRRGRLRVMANTVQPSCSRDR